MRKFARHAAGAIALGLVFAFAASSAVAAPPCRGWVSRTNQGIGTSGLARPIHVMPVLPAGGATRVYLDRSRDPVPPARVDGLWSRHWKPQQGVRTNKGLGISRVNAFER